MTRILVTGGAGYVGSHTCKALSLAGYVPVTLDDLSGGHASAVCWGPLVVGHIADTTLVPALIAREKISAVLHFAGRIQVGESVRQPDLYYTANVSHSLAFLEAVLAAGVRTLVFSSSAAVYGHPQSTPVREDHPLAPVNPYGETKRVIEEALRWHGAAYGLRWMALRYFNAAGADPEGETGEAHEPETHLIPLLLEAALGRSPPVPVLGNDYPTPDGTAIRDYVHVSDLAEAHVRALEYLNHGGASGVLNLGSGSGHSVQTVLDTAAALLGHAVPHTLAPRRAGDPPVLVADPGQARQMLGWSPSRSDLSTLLTTALAWHRRRSFPDDVNVL